MTRVDWEYVLNEAADIVESYRSVVTLRQLFYRLVSRELLENTQSMYNSLSSRSAKARRQGWFPDLFDAVRVIDRAMTWDGAEEAQEWIRTHYRRDRTEGQDYSIYVAVEKDALARLLFEWFGDNGIPILVLRGYSSQSYCDQIKLDVEKQDRPAVLIYAGDFDPSGEDIYRDFLQRTDCWYAPTRIALNPAQIEEYNLPPLPGKAKDSRAAGFVRRHGALMQVELDALEPSVLHDLYTDEVFSWWSEKEARLTAQREAEDRSKL